jgi:hypothetical protein
MSEVSLERKIDELRNAFDDEWGPVQEILENGEYIGNGHWSAVFYNPDIKPLAEEKTDVDQMDEVVAKVFSGDKIENIRERIERAHPDYFPESVPLVCDTTRVENPRVPIKEEDAAVVVQQQSDSSILEDTPYDVAVSEATQLVDDLVRRGQIMDDFKAEAIHWYGDQLKYVDFEDKAAVKDWPLHEDPSTNGDVTYEMALMYANLSTGLKDSYDKAVEDVKDDIALESEIIDSEVYEEKGFVPQMIGEWHYS